MYERFLKRARKTMFFYKERYSYSCDSYILDYHGAVIDCLREVEIRKMTIMTARLCRLLP